MVSGYARSAAVRFEILERRSSVWRAYRGRGQVVRPKLDDNHMQLLHAPGKRFLVPAAELAGSVPSILDAMNLAGSDTSSAEPRTIFQLVVSNARH
jgi:hypothetical protein